MPLHVRQIPLLGPNFKEKKVIGAHNQSKCAPPYEEYSMAVLFTTFNRNDPQDEENAVQSLMRKMDYEERLESNDTSHEVTMMKYDFGKAPKHMISEIGDLDYYGEEQTVFIYRNFFVSDEGEWIPITMPNAHSDDIVHVMIAKAP